MLCPYRALINPAATPAALPEPQCPCLSRAAGSFSGPKSASAGAIHYTDFRAAKQPVWVLLMPDDSLHPKSRGLSHLADPTSGSVRFAQTNAA